jgi:S1-C subfamily serine protease
MMLKNLVLAMLSVSLTAPPTVPEIVLLKLNGLVRVSDNKGYFGLGFNVDGLYVTAQHVVENGHEFFIESLAPLQGKIKATPTWKSKNLDLAYLAAAQHPLGSETFKIAKTRPSQGDPIYFLCWAPLAGDMDNRYETNSPVVVSGTWGGVNKYIAVMAWAGPGCSGSPILNSDGDVVGILVGSRIWGEHMAPLTMGTPLLGALPRGKSK